MRGWRSAFGALLLLAIKSTDRCGGHGGVAADETHNLPKKGSFEGYLKSGERAVLCVNLEDDSRSNHSKNPFLALLSLPKVFKPLQVRLRLAEGKLKVVSASEDSLHDDIDSMVQGWLGQAPRLGGDLREKLAVRASPAGRNLLLLPNLSLGVGDCPPPWSSEPSICELRLSPFGASCMAVSMRGGGVLVSAEGVHYVVTTGTPFAWSLLGRFLAGVALLCLSYELSKSKIFQYGTGVAVGSLAGVIVLGLYLLRRRKDIANIIMASATTYSLALYYWIRTYFTQIVSSHWEVLMAYMSCGALLGVIVVSLVRHDERSKHEARVLVRWAVRVAGVVLIFTSLCSSFAQGIAAVGLVIAYLVYKVKKVLRRSSESKMGRRDYEYEEKDDRMRTPPRTKKQR